MITRMMMTSNHKQRHENPQKRVMYTPRRAARAPHVQPHVHGMYIPARADVHGRPSCGERIIVSPFVSTGNAVEKAFYAFEAPDYVIREFS